MPDYAFRGKPVASWTDADFDAFRQHIVQDSLTCGVPVEAGKSGSFLPKGRVRNIFDSASFAGAKNSPFEWHREVKSRLNQAELVNQDLELLRQCSETGRLDALSDESRVEMFDGMASKMATIRYGYEAGRNPARAEDYKSHMAMSMKYGGVDMVQGDIDQWRSSMQELLNSEYDKAMRPGSRYVCRFYNRDGLDKNFDAAESCVFFDANLLDAYVQEYVADRMAAQQPIKDMFRFTTAAGDYDLKYRVTKSMAVAQGLRVMPKEDWVNNSKAQAAFSNMAGWGLSGDKFAISDNAVRIAQSNQSPDVWLLESKARVERANKLYEDLEALSELPLDKHGSLKYQPSFSACAKCGWVPDGNSDKKSSPKERERVFQRELLLRVADVLYGQDVARELQSNFRKASDIPVDLQSGKNDIQSVWSELRSGDFNAVKDRVIEWSGARLEIIEQEDALRASGAAPAYSGTYHGGACQVYSDGAAVACMGDIFKSHVLQSGDMTDKLDLPAGNLDLMYGVYTEAAKVRGDNVVDFTAWHAGILANPDLDMSIGEFDSTRPVIAKPVYLSAEELQARAEASMESNVPEEFVNQDSYAGMPEPSGFQEAEFSGFDLEGESGESGQVGQEVHEEPVLVDEQSMTAYEMAFADADTPDPAAISERDMRDLNAAAEMIRSSEDPSEYEACMMFD